MNDFVAINQNKLNNYIIKNNGFFPDINVVDLRTVHNIDGTVTDARLKACAITAIGRVNLDLSSYQDFHHQAGCKTLAEVKAQTIDDVSYVVQLYLQAVYCHVQALLLEKYGGFDATKAQIDKTVAVDTMSGHYYRESRYAIRDILAVPRSSVILV